MNVITRGGTVYAAVLRQEDREDEENFVTPEDWPLQVGRLQEDSGTTFAAHRHPPQERAITRTMEVFVVLSGVMEVTLYDEDTPFETVRLEHGDVYIHFQGGHSLDILETANIIEVKQGPYKGKQQDKTLIGDDDR